MQRFTELKVWQRAHALALDVYRLTAKFPAGERYGITSQIRRAAVSVPTNIAEGSKRRFNREYARFLNIAEGSLVETEYLLLLSRDLGYLDSARWKSLTFAISELQPMLHTLRSKVEHEAETSTLKPSTLDPRPSTL